jgi:hypothetical protein
MRTVRVTGGAGFIGSHCVKRLLHCEGVARVTVLDALTYAGHIENLGKPSSIPSSTSSIATSSTPSSWTAWWNSSHVAHFAAESHVDRSFYEVGNFLTTNVLGTRPCWTLLPGWEWTSSSTSPSKRCTGRCSLSGRRGGAASAERALRGIEGSQRPGGVVVLPDLRRAGVCHELVEQLRAWPAPGEDHPIVHHPAVQRRAGHPPRPRPACVQLAARRGQLRRHRTGPVLGDTRRCVQHRRRHGSDEPGTH